MGVGGGRRRGLAARVLERWEHVTQTLLRAKAGAAQQADWALRFRAAHVLRRLESRHSTRLMRAALDDAAPRTARLPRDLLRARPSGRRRGEGLSDN